MIQNALHPYEQAKHLSFNLCGECVTVISKPGLAEWDQLPPSTELLAKYSSLLPTDNVLVMGCHHGALSVFIARHLPLGQLSVCDSDNIALEATCRTLATNNITSVKIISDINLKKSEKLVFDAALVHIPKGRKLTRRWLLQAYQALRNGGSLYISGSNQAGIQSAIKDAVALFGNGQVLAYKKGNRIHRLVKQSTNLSLPEWADTPGIAPGTWVEFSISISGYCYQIRSLPGIFSFGHLDAGTKLLLSVMDILPGCKVLDVGCGYGIIGLYAATHGASWVDLIDNDLQAIAACNETLTINKISNVSVITSDLLEQVGLKKYDHILSNPPFHTGQAVSYQTAVALIEQSYQALLTGGRLSIVANRFIPYDRLINGTFGNVQCLAETGRFYVLSGVRIE